MIVVARDTSTARISTVLEVMLAKFPAACSGDVLSSYVMCACKFKHTTEEELYCTYLRV